MRMVPDGLGQAGGSGGDLPASVRVDACLKLIVEKPGSRLRLAERHESGAFRFRMPRREAGAIEAMLVNVAGGLAGGDRVLLEAEVREGASLVLSSAAGERIYRSGGDETRISIDLRAEANATLVWLPNETILHDGARFRRDVSITLHPRARLLFGEVIQLGRVASGERFRSGMMIDQWRVSIGGRMAFAEATRLEREMLARSQRPGGLGNAPFMATLLLAGEGAADRLAAIRQALVAEPSVMAAATAHSGLVFARLLSEDDVAQRRVFLSAIRAASGDDLPLPRVLMAGL